MNLKDKTKESFMKLGFRIKSLREQRDITIKELSAATGIRKEYLEKIEIGTAYGVELERHLVKIVKVFKVKLSELFYFDNLKQ